MKKHWKLMVVVLGLLVVLAGAAQVVGGRNHHSDDKLDIAAVKRGDLQVEVVESGTVRPVSQVEVKSKVSGRVLQLYADEGDTVAAGQMLARLEIPELLSRRDQIQAQLSQAQERLTESQVAMELERKRVTGDLQDATAAREAAQASLKQLQDGARPEEIAQAQSRLNRTEAQHADAQRNFNRQQELFTQGFVSKDAVDRAQTQLDLANSDVDSAREALALLKAGARKEELDAAKARLRQAEVQLTLAQSGDLRLQQAQSRLRQAAGNVTQLRSALNEVENSVHDADIVAPTAGVVIARGVEAGTMVISATGGFSQGTTIVTIADLSRMQVDIDLNEVDVAKIRVDSEAGVEADALRGQEFAGHVTRISSAALSAQSTSSGLGSAQVVKFLVEVTLDAPGKELRPGMSAKVTIKGESHKATLYLPREAVIKRESGEYVKQITDEPKFREARQRGEAKTTAASQKASGKVTRPDDPSQSYVPLTFTGGHETKVVTGLVTPLWVEILSGLNEGDKAFVEPEHPERRGFNFGP